MDILSLPFLALLVLALGLLLLFVAIARGTSISRPVGAAPIDRRDYR